MDEPKDSFLKTLLKGYRLTALILLNTLIGLIILNGVLSLVFMIKDNFIFLNSHLKKKYNSSTINLLYNNYSQREFHDLFKETWGRPCIFEPFTQFKESPYKGYYVNVDKNGFRQTKNQGAWPPLSKSLNIFLFGGSTTFGYGVADDQTIASHLQEYLTKKLGSDVRVYNFGRAYYYSTQERILYEKLLSSGNVPDLAIFIDGLNDFINIKNEPGYTSQLREFLDTRLDTRIKALAGALFSVTSLGRAVSGIRSRIASHLKSIGDIPYNNPVLIDQIIKTYQTNKKLIEAISKVFGVKPIFVWQPVPIYNHNQIYLEGFPQHIYSNLAYIKNGYMRMANLAREEQLSDNFFWCADIQMDLKVPVYMDKCHYSPNFSKFFAEIIANLLIERYDIKKQSYHITTDQN